MNPVLFEIGSVKIHGYGFMIALGIVAGMAWLVVEGRKRVGLTFDQANRLFLLIFLAAVVGGKLFLFFEDPAGYVANPLALVSGSGFVFYGSFLLAIPTMLLYFRHRNLPAMQMLDIIAITTCLVHIFGRVGCFFAGCCHGRPTDSWLSVTFTDPACFAEPLNTPLIPTQLLEAAYIFFVMLLLLVITRSRKFHGQVFLSYLMFYAAGRFILEYFRGDLARGFVVENYISHSQFIALAVLLTGGYFYLRIKSSVVARGA